LGTITREDSSITDIIVDNDQHFLNEYSRYLDSSGSHLTYAALSTYLNFGDELSLKEKSFLKSHLDSCSSCSLRLREVQEVEHEKVQQFPPGIRWTASPMFRYAIAAMIVLVLGAVVSLFVFRDAPQEQLASQSPSPDQPLTVLGPERFASNPVLDGFIDRAVRSASAAAFLVPSAGDTVNPPINFVWERSKGPFSLTILDNKGQQVRSVNSTEAHAIVDTQLVPGLYYAKLEAGGNLAAVTKFYIIPR
jgi:hypothetical protein